MLIATDRGDGYEGPTAAGAAVVAAATIVFAAFLSSHTSKWFDTQPANAPDVERKPGIGLDDLPARRRNRRKLTLFGWVAVALAGALAVVVAPILMGAATDGRVALGTVIAVAALLAAANFGVAHASGDRFWPVAAAVFFSVLVFGAVLAGMRAIQSPFVQPAALIRKDDVQDEGILGLYIAETGDRVWLGAVCQRKGNDAQSAPNSGRIFWVAKGDVVAMSIGPLQRLETARTNSLQLLKSLMALRIPDSKATKRSARDPEKEPAVRAAAKCLQVNRRPHASVTVRRLAADPRLLILDASGSTDADGRVARYEWDGTARRSPVLTYRLPRSQRKDTTITLRVIDDETKKSTRRVIKILAPISARPLFRTDEDALRRRGRALLRKRLAPVLRARAKHLVFVQIEGHTDNTGSEAHNHALSDRRAKAVARFVRKTFNVGERLIRSRGVGELLLSLIHI